MSEQPNQKPPDLRGIPGGAAAGQVPPALRVEGAGRSDRLATAPYGELYWFEGRRAGFPAPGRWWRFDGAGIVGTPVKANAASEAAAAAAVDAARLSFALGHTGPQAGPDLHGPKRVVTKAIHAANTSIRARAAASGQPVPHTCSLLVAAVQGGMAAVGLAGEGGAYLIRGRICVPVARVAQNYTEEGDQPNDDATGGLLGEAEEAAPVVWTFGLRSGDLLLLFSGGVQATVGDPDLIEDFVGECSSLEEACERILIEAKLRKAEGPNSVVLLGVDLDPTSTLFVDPARDRLPYYVALRGAEMQGTPGHAQLTSGRELLQLMGNGGLPNARALGPSAFVPNPPPASPEVPAPPSPEPARGYEPERRSARSVWHTISTGLMVAAGLVIVGASVWLMMRNGGPPPSLTEGAVANTEAAAPTTAEEGQPLGPASAAAEEGESAFSVDFSGLGSTLHARLGVSAPFPVELVIQSARKGSAGTADGLVWTELKREVLEPGESVVFLLEALRGSHFDSPTGVTVSARYEDGRLEWDMTDPMAMPEGIVASILAGKLHLADRERGLFIVLRPLPLESPEPDEEGAGGLLAGSE